MSISQPNQRCATTSRQRKIFRRLKRLRGAALAEYLPLLFLMPIVVMAGYQQYGGALRQQVGTMAGQMASNYYQGWFYPVIKPLSPGSGQSSGGSSHNYGPAMPGSESNSGSNSDGNTGGSIDGGYGNSSSNSGSGSVVGGTGGANDYLGGYLGGTPSDPFGGGGAQQCGVSPGDDSINGAASGFDSPAVMSAAPTHTLAGNPINFGNGNKFQQQSDYRHFFESPLTFQRYYNSVQTNVALSLGHGWRHSYQRQIVVDDGDTDDTDSKHKNATPQSLKMVRDDGSVYLFQCRGDQWAAKGVVDQLKETEQGHCCPTVWDKQESLSSSC